MTDDGRSLEQLWDRIPVGVPPVPDLIRAAKRKQRRQRRIGAGSVAAVAALVVGAAAIWLPGSNSTAQPPAATNETAGIEDQGLPSPPDGARWVGINRVMVAVPHSWTVNDTYCGQQLSNTVDFFGGVGRDCLVAESRQFSVLWPLDSRRGKGADIALVEGAATTADGLEATRSETLCEAGVCHGTLSIPESSAVFYVASPDPDLVDRVLDSARTIPDGYTAVPDISLRGDAAHVMRRAGLRWEPPRCPASASCESLRPLASLPIAGSVVPLGTGVVPRGKGGAIPPSDPSCTATDFDRPAPPDQTVGEAVQEFMGDIGGRYDLLEVTSSVAQALVTRPDGSTAELRLEKGPNGGWGVASVVECT